MFDSVKLYAIGAAAVALLGLVLFAGWQYDHAQDLNKQLGAMELAQKNTQASLDHLQAGIDISNDAITAMAAAQAQVTQHGGMVRARVQTLRSTNDAIRTWLDGTLPPNGCMLDDTCAGSPTGIPVSSAASAVR